MVYTVTSKKALVTAGEEGILNLKLGGPCRARTYDPLIKRLVFSPSSGVQSRPIESEI